MIRISLPQITEMTVETADQSSSITNPNLSKVKMVVTDMDGTLLNSQHEVPNGFFEVANQLLSHGIRIVAASGRQYDSIIDKLKPIKDQIYVIAENGGIAKYQNEELSSATMKFSQVKEVLEHAIKIENATVVLCGKKGAYIYEKDRDFIPILSDYYTIYHLHEDLFRVEDEIMKIAIYHPASSEDFLYPKLNQLETTLSVRVSAQHWLDISLPTTNKGVPLEALQKSLSILPDQTLAFGDYHNDIEMLSKARLNYAMANAHEDVKQVASYQTLGNNEAGVLVVLNKLLKDIEQAKKSVRVGE